MEYRESMEKAAVELVEKATERSVTIATAESLTAGLTAATIADIPGASAVLRGGAVTYCDEVKHHVLGVSRQTLEEHTAVSEDTALEMAEGARRLFESDIAVSLTGYAGPDGGGPDKPAGTVYIAISDRDEAFSIRCQFEGNRNEVRFQAALKALALLINRVDSLEML